MDMTLIHALLISTTDCYLSLQCIKHGKKSVTIQLKLLSIWSGIILVTHFTLTQPNRECLQHVRF